MDHFQNQYTPTPQSGSNPVTQTDEFGNPIFPSGGATTGGPYDTGFGPGIGTTTGHHDQHKLHRSGSSSSSSSEDDGQGGRRKKGLKEKIKEKMPGTHKGETHSTATTTPIGVGGGHHATATGYGGGHHATATGYGGEVHEKKGIMDKIKEKLPGHHDHH